MALSKVGLANDALQLAKARGRISVLSPPDSENAIKVNNCWERIEKEVLEAVRPKFATIRTTLSKSSTTPAYGWSYAYALPEGFICMADEAENDSTVFCGYDSIYMPYWINNGSPSKEYIKVNSRNWPYVIENLDDDNLYILTNWDNETMGDIYLRYIKYGVSVSRWNPAFATAFVNRLASDLALSIAEDTQRSDWLMKRYETFKYQAISKNSSFDYVDDMGINDWSNAQ